MNIKKEIIDLFNITNKYYNPSDFYVFYPAYYAEAEWFSKQLQNILDSQTNLGQKLLVLLFSLDFENNKKNDTFVKAINKVRNNILKEFDQEEKETLAFQLVHEKSIEDARKALKNQPSKVAPVSFLGKLCEKDSHPQKKWINMVDNESSIEKKGYSFPVDIEINENIFEVK